MTQAVLIKGRLVGPRQVELDEPVPAGSTDVEVLVRAAGATVEEETWSEYVRRLPPGQRSQADINAQLHSERDAWDNKV